MAEVTLVLPGAPPPQPVKRVTITWHDGAITSSFAVLRAVGFDGYGVRWIAGERPGRHPLDIRSGKKATQATLELLVQSGDLVGDVEEHLEALRQIANSLTPIVVVFGEFGRWTPTGFWVVDNLAVTPELWVQGTNDVARAVATLTLRSASTPAMERRT